MSVNSSRFEKRIAAWGILALVLLSATCKRELALASASVCDDFADGSCKIGAPPSGVYKFALPAAKTNTWFDLGYFMYFHARQTPGMRVELTRPMPPDVPSDKHCAFTLRRGDQAVEGHLEGMRWDEDRRGFWCFDYLGSMLIQFHKKFGSVRSSPEMSFFPVRLSMQWQGGPVRAEVTEEIRLEWTAEGAHE